MGFPRGCWWRQYCNFNKPNLKKKNIFMLHEFLNSLRFCSRAASTAWCSFLDRWGSKRLRSDHVSPWGALWSIRVHWPTKALIRQVKSPRLRRPMSHITQMSNRAARLTEACPNLKRIKVNSEQNIVTFNLLTHKLLISFLLNSLNRLRIPLNRQMRGFIQFQVGKRGWVKH